MTLFRTSEWYGPELLRANPDYIFVFGDNLQRTGKGGQAIIRDEPNALGLATKCFPGMNPEHFFLDAMIEDEVNLLHDIAKVYHRALTENVVIPFSTRVELGTGLSQLPERAPALYAILSEHFTIELPVAPLVIPGA